MRFLKKNEEDIYRILEIYTSPAPAEPEVE